LFKVEPFGTQNSNPLLENNTAKPFIIKALQDIISDLAHPLHKNKPEFENLLNITAFPISKKYLK